MKPFEEHKFISSVSVDKKYQFNSATLDDAQRGINQLLKTLDFKIEIQLQENSDALVVSAFNVTTARTAVRKRKRK